MSTTVDVARHDTDAYTIDYFTTAAQGRMTDLERANLALAQADWARVQADTHGDDLDKAQAAAACERVALAASACGKASRIGSDDLASLFADKAHEEALVLSTFDYVNVG